MPQYNEYPNASAQDTDSGDIILWEIDGVTYKMSADELIKAVNRGVLNFQSGTSYTAAIGDMGKYVLMNNASANTFTIPPNSSVAYPIGTTITVIRQGSGTTTIVQGSGVTIDTANDNLEISRQFSAMVLIKIGTDAWMALGGGAGSSLPQLATPASLTMTANGENDMDFAWSDVANESGFEIQIAEDAGFTVNVQTDNVGAGILATSFTGLTEGTTYYGRVKAEGNGVTHSDSGYATDSEDTDDSGLLGLNTPTGFTATPDGADMDLAWTDTNSSPNESGYEIRRNSTNTTVGSTLINSPASNATSYTDTNPGAGTWYYFIKAKGNGTTTGDSSNASTSGTIAGGTALKDLMAWTTFHDPDADVTTRVAGADTFVTAMKDQMALGTSARNLANSTDATQPKLLPSTVNGKAVIWIHGDAMNLVSTAASITLSKPFTRCGFTVLKSFRSSVRYSLSSISALQACDLGHYDSGAGQRAFIYSGNILYEETAIDVVTIDALCWQHMEFVGDGSTDKYYRNNVLQATGDAGSNTALQGLRLGANVGSTDGADVWIGITCIYPGIMTSGERLTLYNAVKAYYNIP